MMSIRGLVNYQSNVLTIERPEPAKPSVAEIEVCPHCGGSLRYDPNDTFNLIEHKVLVRSRRVPGLVWERPATPKAWNLLMFLLKNMGKFLSTERVLMSCFDEEVDSGIVTVQIGVIRKLLSGTEYFIETKYGLGYRLLRNREEDRK